MGCLGAKLASLAAATALAALPCAASATANVSVTYAYDTHGRVIGAIYSNGVTITYTYDAAGNRTSQVVGATKVIVVNLGGTSWVIPVP